MRVFGFAVVASVFLAAPVALGQQSTPFTDAMLLIAQPCIEGPTIDICTKADRDIVARAAQEPTLQPGHEQNVYRSMRSLISVSLGVEMGKGALFGEIGIFSHDKSRTATAKTLEDSSLLLVTADKARELYYQNPDFGFFIVDLITRRLMEDAAAGTLKP